MKIQLRDHETLKYSCSFDMQHSQAGRLIHCRGPVWRQHDLTQREEHTIIGEVKAVVSRPGICVSRSGVSTPIRGHRWQKGALAGNNPNTTTVASDPNGHKWSSYTQTQPRFQTLGAEGHMH